jgi:hypothetical protein
MTDNELLQQCKDEVANKYGINNWHSLVSQTRNIIQMQGNMEEVAELYASKLREKDQERIKELEDLLARSYHQLPERCEDLKGDIENYIKNLI